MKPYLLALLLFATPAHAQTPAPIAVTGTSGISFSPSVDHNTLDAGGIPVLTRYEARFIPSAGCAAVPPYNIGKPANVPTILVKPISTFGILQANCIYTLVLVSVGPGGEGATPASDPFVRVVSPVPQPAGSKPAIVP